MSTMTMAAALPSLSSDVSRGGMSTLLEPLTDAEAEQTGGSWFSLITFAVATAYTLGGIAVSVAFPAAAVPAAIYFGSQSIGYGLLGVMFG